jgi:xanthine dehydrogenase large subunit
MKNTNSLPHESARGHVTGEAVYVADMHMGQHLLTGRVVFSQHAHARIKSYDLSAALKLPGVVTILDYKSIPGNNQLNHLVHDEPCLAKDTVHCIGQAMFLIAAEDEETAVKAEKLIQFDLEVLEPVLSIEKAMELDLKLAPTRRIECGEPDRALNKSKHKLRGKIRIGGQEHWYLETQAAVCVPDENRGMKVYASSQNPTETQMIVAGVLGLPANQVECEVKRMGGGFGGKETQANHLAAWAALLADATKRPVKINLFRDDDQKYTGKRHRFLSTYEIGFDDNGLINAYITDMNGDAGMATDLSMAILERALFHADNSYFIPNLKVTGTMWKTNLPSNTAFRGFGGPQGMAVIENAIDRIARYLKKDAAEIRYLNFYGEQSRNQTHYGQIIDRNRLFVLWNKLYQSSDYKNRRKSINEFNRQNQHQKKGLALTPVKFGISFTTSFLNQAGALVQLYKDGTMLVNHGGTEMGQGLHTKILQIASLESGLPIDDIKVNATNTSKVPNTSPTAASASTDLNGMAVRNAIHKLCERLRPLASAMLSVPEKDVSLAEVVFADGAVYAAEAPESKISFSNLVQQAHKASISLSATGYYATPGLSFDKLAGQGHPFHYFAFGMAVSEVLIDTLTGMHKLLRTDILHDVGDSINEAIDLGQVIGGYIQGVGWCTTETLRWAEDGRLLNHSPDTYKIPGIGDIPEDFQVALLSGAPNPNVIRKSKAVGEPPFMLAFSTWLAIKDAISATANHLFEPDFELPANNEVILMAITGLKEKTRQV